MNAPLRGDGRIRIERLAWRSSQDPGGALFFCAPHRGQTETEVARKASASGARAIVASRWLPLRIPQIRVPSIHTYMGRIASEFYDRPSDKLVVAAVTGTNGKTTVTYLLESIFKAAGLTPGVVGNTGVWLDGELLHPPSAQRSFQSPLLHRRLHELREGGALAVAMEAWAYALEQHRLNGLHVACAIFTNFTRDHLRHFGTMHRYLRAKAKLFTPQYTDRIVLNADAPESFLFVRSDLPVLTYGIARPADLNATEVQTTAQGVSFRVGDLRLRSPLLGLFNVENCLAAAAGARCLGLEDDVIAEGLETVRPVPGRLQPIQVGQEFRVFVDYAHTPDGLDKMLDAVRPLTPGRILLVTCCGGDRDRGKRPMMAEIATAKADLTVMTTTSPGSEDPLDIIADWEAGAAAGRYVVEVDRRSAIAMALGKATHGDTVVIAGHGHETEQNWGDHTVPFDDRVVATEELARLTGAVRDGGTHG
ncbi:MAG: UDP-N-acetylmuramoyl-L-alanyl-D-glutamate--2,6-diaminopimelate ligase [Actinomycetota bacterium]